MKQLPWIATNAHQRMNGNAWTVDWLKVPWCRQIVVMFMTHVFASHQSAVSEVLISCLSVLCRQVKYMHEWSFWNIILDYFFEAEIFSNFNHTIFNFKKHQDYISLYRSLRNLQLQKIYSLKYRFFCMIIFVLENDHVW